MNRIVATVLSLAVVTGLFTAAPAFAGEREKPNFPMTAEAFQQRVETRLANGKARLEKRITDKSVDAEHANQMRAHFDERAAKVRAAVAVAAADGTVTADEAKAVHEASGHHGHHRHHADPKG